MRIKLFLKKRVMVLELSSLVESEKEFFLLALIVRRILESLLALILGVGGAFTGLNSQSRIFS